MSSFFLPLLSMLTSICYIFLDFQRALLNLTPNQTLGINITQYVLDFISSVTLEFVLWYRLHLFLQAEGKLGSFTVLIHATKILLLLPLSWIVVDVFGILALFDTKYVNTSAAISGAYNGLTGIYDILLHSIFVYLLVTRISSIRKSPKRVRKLKTVAVCLCMNSLILTFGGFYNISDSRVGGVIIYASWVAEVYVFLILNDTFSHMMSVKAGDTLKEGPKTEEMKQNSETSTNNTNNNTANNNKTTPVAYFCSFETKIKCIQ